MAVSSDGRRINFKGCLFYLRSKDKNIKNQQNTEDYQQRVQASSYAALDYSSTYLSHIEANQE